MRCLGFRHDDDIRIVPHDILGIEHGERTQVRRHDVARAETDKHFTDERCGARGVRRAVDLEIHRRTGTAAIRPRLIAHRAHVVIDIPIERRRAIALAQDLSDQAHRAGNVGKRIGIERDGLHAELAQPVGDPLRAADEYHIGPQAHDLLDLGIVEAAGFWQ